MHGFAAGIGAFLIALSMATSASAQDSTNVDVGGSKGLTIKIGPSLSVFGAAMNIDAAEGRKTKADYFFLPTASLTAYMPFGTEISMGARLDVGISSTGTVMRPYEAFDAKKDWAGYIRERYHFFTIAPSFNLAGVNIGAGFNFPMSGSMWHPDRSSEVFHVDRSTMKSVVIDVRLGSMINVWSTNLGTLYVELQAKYFVTGLYKEGKYTLGNTVDQTGIPSQDFRTYEMLDNVPVGAQIGVSYLFNI